LVGSRIRSMSSRGVVSSMVSVRAGRVISYLSNSTRPWSNLDLHRRCVSIPLHNSCAWPHRRRKRPNQRSLKLLPHPRQLTPPKFDVAALLHASLYLTELDHDYIYHAQFSIVYMWFRTDLTQRILFCHRPSLIC
jgi:hypothetical protein